MHAAYYCYCNEALLFFSDWLVYFTSTLKYKHGHLLDMGSVLLSWVVSWGGGACPDCPFSHSESFTVIAFACIFVHKPCALMTDRPQQAAADRLLMKMASPLCCVLRL